MGLEVSEKMVGNVPDNGRFLRYVGADRIEFFIGSHLIRPFVERKYLQSLKYSIEMAFFQTMKEREIRFF
jgi:hypothetical protein